MLTVSATTASVTVISTVTVVESASSTVSPALSVARTTRVCGVSVTESMAPLATSMRPVSESISNRPASLPDSIA